MYIFLDDERNPEQVTWVAIPKPDSWVIVRNYSEFVSLLETLDFPPTHISFDHDLADAHYEAFYREYSGEKGVSYGPEKTGFECAKALIDICIDKSWYLPAYTVHSMNHIGGLRIIQLMEDFKKYNAR